MQNKQTKTAQPWWSKMAIYWLDTHVSITFRSDLPPSAGKQAIINTLDLDAFNQFLNMRGYTLHSFTQTDVPQSEVLTKGAAAAAGLSAAAVQPHDTTWGGNGQPAGDLQSPLGKYVFQAASGQGSLVQCFFTIEQTAPYAMTGTSVVGGMEPAPASSQYGSYAASDMTRQVINMINSARTTAFRQPGCATVVMAAPNWLSSGTGPVSGCGTHGGAITPPLPVEDPAPNWHITLPDLIPALQKRTGTGVTVFILDTQPTLQQIRSAAERAGKNNALLETLVSQLAAPSPLLVLHDSDQPLPEILENGSPDQPFSGRDIFGRLSGFEMSDHGLFVAGIVRDVAPQARIECVRVLNDFGAGSAAVLINTLEDIHNRMLPLNPTTNAPGDLYKKPVVINLSLVTMPLDEELVPLWSSGAYADTVRKTSETEPLTLSLHAVIQSLTALGAVIVGAAGNDSDVRQLKPSVLKPQAMNTVTQRQSPRYPAAFPEIISVGAVDESGHAALYSNYPVAPGSTQNNGVATYGGGLPVPVFPSSVPHDSATGTPFDPTTMVGVDQANIDALVGVYTAPTYPALSTDDQPADYQAPNGNAWAYWSGTSFATPIISGVAARLLEDIAHHLRPDQWHAEVMKAFTNIAVQQTLISGDTPLPREAEFSQGSISISLLNAQQRAINTAQSASKTHSAPLAVK